MAYNEFLADRIRSSLKTRNIGFAEKKMFGGLCFLIDDKMCVGITRDDLMARIGSAAQDEALKRTGCRPMDFTGRPMQGYVFVEPNGYDLDEDLEHWIELCLAFNPLAKASKKKKK